MVLITLPLAPPGIPPYEYYIAVVNAVFNQTPARGFNVRLIVLCTLAAYGILASAIYLTVLLIEYRRRNKRVWLWKLVRRSNGRYLVGNQHFLFAILSFVSGAINIGYFVSFHQVFIDSTHQRSAFYWRTMIWIVYGVHLWITSFSNLQAGILSTQSATKRYVLSPVFMNTLYIGAFFAMLTSCLSLDVVCGWAWAQCWDAHLRALLELDVLAITRPNDTPEQALAIVSTGLLDRVNSRLGLVIATLRATNALYAFGFSLIIVANLGGLALLFTLQRQITFNTRRLSDDQAVSVPTPRPPLPFPRPSEDGPVDPTPCPFSAAPRVDEKAGTVSPAQQVMFVRSVEQTLEGPITSSPDPNVPLPPPPSKGLSVSGLKYAAADQAPTNAAQRQQASQLLALKKVRWDVLILLAAIVVIATSCTGIGLWLAISPTSVYARWATTEVAYFLVPWMFVIGVDVALTLLLLNTLRHVVPTDSFLARVLGHCSKPRRRTSASGLLTSDELDSLGNEDRSGLESSGQQRPPAQRP